MQEKEFGNGADPRAVRHCRFFSGLASVASILTALGTLVGWWLDIPELKSVMPGMALMKPNTAVCFIACGVALWLLREPAKDLGRGAQRVAGVLGAAVVAVGLLTLLEYQFAFQFGIDDVLFGNALRAIGGAFPGRMSPATASSFLLTGASLAWTASRKNRASLSQALALFAVVIGLIGFAGYLYGVQELYRTSTFSTMALHTAALFLVSGTGIFLLRPKEGLAKELVSRALGGTLARVLFPFVFVTPLTVGWIRLQGQYRGWYGTEFGLALFATSQVILLAAMLWAAARWMNRLDGKRIAEMERSTQLAAIVDNSEDAIIGKSTEGFITSWNRGAEQLYGYTEREVTGRHIGMLAPKELQDDIRNILVEIGTGRGVNRENTVRQKKDGSEVHVALSISPVRDRSGKITGASTIARDITERIRAEEQLREQASLLDLSYDGILVWNWDGVVTFWSQGAERIYGYTRKEALGRTSHELLRTKSQAGLGSVLETIQREGKWEGELEQATREGKQIFVESRMVLVKSGKREYVLETNRDITGKMHLEAQLRQSQKMDAIGRLAGGVAHDFNNLLGVILGSAELLEASNNTNRMKWHAAEIRKASEKAASLTRQLLAFSRKQVLEPKVLDMNAVILEMVKMVERLAGENVQIRTSLAADLGAVKLDPSQIEQVLLNLVVNARDAMPEGGKITIETSNADLSERYAEAHPAVNPGQYAMIVVSDSGEGMDEETRTRIFEPFFTTKKEGTGLGLATVYGIVNQSGGHIWVYSERGKGTTFKLYFPIVEKVAGAEKTEAPKENGSHGSETILLVEDSESLRSVTREFLTLGGYSVMEAPEGSEAVEIAKCHSAPIHLLLTDVIMPGMSGREVATRIKEIHPETKVLYMSGYTANAVVNHGELEEGLVLLPKPFTRMGLMQKVRQMLDG